MGRLAQAKGLTGIQRQVIDTARELTDREIIPRAQQLEHHDEYPQRVVQQLAGRFNAS